MAFDGSGNFLRLHNWQSDAANAIDISAPEMDGEDNGFAAGLTLCVTRDGQGKMAADFTPAVAVTYNIGSPGSQWVNGYFSGSVVINGIPIYGGVPQNIQATNYTLVASDAGKHIYQNGVGVHTYTIPSNASVPFPIGTVISGINGHGAGALTVAITTDSLIFSPSGGVGSRSVSADGIFTILKVTATAWYITGTGIT